MVLLRAGGELRWLCGARDPSSSEPRERPSAGEALRDGFLGSTKGLLDALLPRAGDALRPRCVTRGPSSSDAEARERPSAGELSRAGFFGSTKGWPAEPVPLARAGDARRELCEARGLSLSESEPRERPSSAPVPRVGFCGSTNGLLDWPVPLLPRAGDALRERERCEALGLRSSESEPRERPSAGELSRAGFFGSTKGFDDDETRSLLRRTGGAVLEGEEARGSELSESDPRERPPEGESPRVGFLESTNGLLDVPLRLGLLRRAGDALRWLCAAHGLTSSVSDPRERPSEGEASRVGFLGSTNGCDEELRSRPLRAGEAVRVCDARGPSSSESDERERPCVGRAAA